MDEKIRFVIEIDETGQPVIKGISNDFEKLESTAAKTGGTFQTLKTHWMALTAAIAAGAGTAYKAWDLMNVAAKAEQERAAFENLAASFGKSGEQIIDELKRVSVNAIDTATLVQKAGAAMMRQINPDQIIQLMEIARATTKMTGKSMAEAFDDLSTAVARQSSRMLKNMGIFVQAKAANAEYAGSLGDMAESLSTAEERQAFLNATIQGGQELMARMGEQTKTSAEYLQSFTALWHNIKEEIGAGIITLVQAFAMFGVWIDMSVKNVIAGIYEMWSGFLGLIEKLPLLEDNHKQNIQKLRLEVSTTAAEFRQAAKDAEKFFVEIGKMREAKPPTGIKPPDAPKAAPAMDPKLVEELEKATNEYQIALAARSQMEIFMDGEKWAALKTMEQEHRTWEMEQLTASAEFKAALDQSEYDRALALMEARTALEVEAEQRRKEALEGRLDAYEQDKAMSEEMFNSTNKLATAFEQLKQTEISYAAIRGTVKNAIAGAILGYESFGQAIKKATAQLLAQIAAESAVRAIYETAYGFAAMARYDFGAASNHFTSAAIFAAVAAAAGVAAKAVMSSAGGATAGESAGYQEARGASVSSGGNVESVARAGEAQPYAQKWDVTIVNPIGTGEWVENTLVPELKKVAKRDTQITVTYA